jgi:hypothetical protein
VFVLGDAGEREPVGSATEAVAVGTESEQEIQQAQRAELEGADLRLAF